MKDFNLFILLLKIFFNDPSFSNLINFLTEFPWIISLFFFCIFYPYIKKTDKEEENKK